MKKFVFFGDSITDACRNRERDLHPTSYGHGYVRALVPRLLEDDLTSQIYNRGCSGDRIVDIYARIKSDVWNLEPDVLTILIGVNDVWHELNYSNGVDIDRYETIYRMLLDQTLERKPDVKIILIEPFILTGAATDEKFEEFLVVKDYAKVVNKIAKDYNLPIVKLQDKLDMLAQKNGAQVYLGDGVHPTIFGAELICNEWYSVYSDKVKGEIY